MNKAFLFDMDGVLADSQHEWDKIYDQFLLRYFGQVLKSRVKNVKGLSIKGIFDAYVEAGFEGQYADFHAKHAPLAGSLYAQAPLTPGIEECINYLEGQGYLLGIVSNSPSEWVEQLLLRLPNPHKFTLKVSVNNHEALHSKPAPDGYLYAMKELGSTPGTTFILEDSATGIASGKASGATVIGYTGNNRGDTHPAGADHYAKNMGEVQAIVAKYGRS